MRAPVDPLGEVLLRTGALTEELLADALDQQRHTLSLGSLCYVLGYLDEDAIARALSRQFGVPSVVLDRCIIRLSVLDGVPRSTALRYNALPIYEDERRIFIAAQDPRAVPSFLRELGLIRGKTPVLHVALEVTLARTLRGCYLALERGDPLYRGPLVEVHGAGASGRLAAVSDVEPGPVEAIGIAPVDRLLVDRATRELAGIDGLMDTTEELSSGDDLLSGTSESLPPEDLATQGDLPPVGHLSRFETEVERADTSTEVVDLVDGGPPRPRARGDEKRALVATGDGATRRLLVELLQSLRLTVDSVATGGEAIGAFKADPPDIAIVEAALPEVDGFQICRAIKQSSRHRHIAVILVSSAMTTTRVTDDVLRLYEVEAYFEKPIDTARLERRVRELLAGQCGGSPGGPDDSFERAIDRYKAGDVDGAVELLRVGLEADPGSAKHHFVLANLLQKKAMIYEAIDEYETTIELKPDYFPALTRLAYLYYRQGYSARAIEMWRRSLPHCTDQSLRQNIEVFMRKLIAGMH